MGRGRVPPSGWYVEVAGPQGTLTPRVVGRPTLSPGLSELPRLSIPVERDAKYRDPRLENVDMDVWFDGRLQPVDRLETVRVTEAATVLEGRGGLALDTNVELEVDSDQPQTVVTDIIQQAGLDPDVDAFEAGVIEGEEVQSVATNTEFDGVTSGLAATVPASVDGDSVANEQTCWVESTDPDTTENGATYFELPGANATSDAFDDRAETQAINAGFEFVEMTATPQHDIPAGNVRAFCRVGNPNGVQDGVGFELQVDTETVFTAGDGYFLSDNWAWFDGVASGGITAGSATDIQVQGLSGAGGSDDTHVDVLGFYDDRFSHSFPDSVDGNYALSGPALYPDAVDVTFDTASTTITVTAGEATTTMSSTAGSQALAISNDGFASNIVSASNSDTVSGSFASGGGSIQLRVTLSRRGSRSGVTPTQGYLGQSITSYALTVDGEDTPLILNQTFDQPAIDALTRIADDIGAVWAYTPVGPNGTPAISWTYPGQRERANESAPSEYELTTSTEATYQEVTVRGSSRNEFNEVLTADHGTAVALNQSPLVVGSVNITEDGSYPRTQYTAGDDYAVDHINGEITTLASGAISDGESLLVDYRWTPEATESVSGVSDPRTRTVNIPAVSTVDGCENAAKRILRRVREPLQEGTLTIPGRPAEVSALDALAVADLPGTPRVQPREIEVADGRQQIQFASRASADDIIETIRSRLDAVLRGF